MNYADIKKVDIANGIGCRVSLWVSGCTIRCPGCHNECAWDFSYGKEFTKETEDYILELLKPNYIAGLSVLGGEPLDQDDSLVKFLRRVKTEMPNKTIWLYTGYKVLSIIDISEPCIDLMDDIDVIVDGPFVEDLKSLNLRFRGSTNQRIIDVKKSKESGEIVLYQFPTDWSRV